MYEEGGTKYDNLEETFQTATLELISIYPELALIGYL